jgi:hypothetical protein
MLMYIGHETTLRCEGSTCWYNKCFKPRSNGLTSWGSICNFHNNPLSNATVNGNSCQLLAAVLINEFKK